MEDATLAGSFLARLSDLTEDSPSDAYIVPGQIEIRHNDDWHIVVAYYEDDCWWVDFTGYGQDGHFGSSTGSREVER